MSARPGIPRGNDPQPVAAGTAERLDREAPATPEGEQGEGQAFRLVRRGVAPEHHNVAAARASLEARKLPKAVTDFRASAPYFQLDAGLEIAINMALAVGAPLLLTGEPGTGKTQVAFFLGWYFGIPVFEYQVRSTSTAEDLKYDFDAVGYLRAAQHPSAEEKRRERHEFITEKALWQAYLCGSDAVLLIDEIDKAPRDFPNDLLQELDKHRFKHPFKEEFIEPASGRPPVVVITSNAERRLPDAFLRRCIVHHIELTEDLVARAIGARVADFPRLAADIRTEALKRFWELRDPVHNLQKRPSTAELLAWLTILSARGVTAQELRGTALPGLPGITALIKDRDDLKRLRSHA
jgi:MoxR-like ATPase